MFVLRVNEEGWKTGGADLQTALRRGWRMLDSVRREKTKNEEGRQRREKQNGRGYGKGTQDEQKDNIESRDSERGGGIPEESADRWTG